MNLKNLRLNKNAVFYFIVLIYFILIIFLFLSLNSFMSSHDLKVQLSMNVSEEIEGVNLTLKNCPVYMNIIEADEHYIIPICLLSIIFILALLINEISWRKI